MKKEIRIKDLYKVIYDEGESPLGHFIFAKYLFNIRDSESNPLDWLFYGFNIDSLLLLDEYYIFFHSGNKIISGGLYNMLKMESEIHEVDILSYANIDEVLTKIGTMIIDRYNEKWVRMAKSLYAEYNPLDNYSMNEEEEIKNAYKDNSKTDSYNRGFGSITDSKIGSSWVESEGTQTNNKSNRTLSRTGKDNKKSYQELIKEELEIRRNDILEIIYNDIDFYLTNIYY